VATLTPELLGLPAFLVLTGFVAFISGLLRGWWVLGREYRAMMADRDYWRTRADRGTQLAERATGVAERVAGGQS
jgi:hypothetical protein